MTAALILPRSARTACLGVMLGCVLFAGCSGKKSSPLPDPVEFEGRLNGGPAKALALTFTPLDEEIAKRSKDIPSVVTDPKTGAFKGKAIPGRYKVTAFEPVLQGTAPAEGPSGQSAGGAPKSWPLGEVDIAASGSKELILTIPR